MIWLVTGLNRFDFKRGEGEIQQLTRIHLQSVFEKEKS